MNIGKRSVTVIALVFLLSNQNSAAEFDFPTELLKRLLDVQDQSYYDDFTDKSYSKFKHDLMTKPIRQLANSAINKPRLCPSRKEVSVFLCKYQAILHDLRKYSSNLLYIKNTNITTYNSNRYNQMSSLFTKWNLKMEVKGRTLLKNYQLTAKQKRMLTLLTKTAEPKDARIRKFRTSLETNVKTTYSKAKICQAKKCYHYEPGVINIMAKSRNYNELLWAWKAWRDAIGPKIRKNWTEIVDIDNLGAWQNGYADMGAYWRSGYDDKNFEKEIDDLWSELKPHYLQLHAYVRRKLNGFYGSKVGLNDEIPAHVLGNMWGMKWNNIIDIVKPYPDVKGYEVTSGMKKKKITVNKMFHLADDFYKSMGLPAMPQSFWNRSMLTRPVNRSVVCYASAFNCEDTDVRVKMCAEVNSEYLYVVHHEMGHCQYYLAYNQKQPELFQSGANHGFHEAIGDTAALSVISITHLKKLGIIQDQAKLTEDQNTKLQINMLMTKALGKLAFYPYALVMAKWRWKVFRGDISHCNLNSGWWKLRKEYQGLRPPVTRSEHDFDPGCKYHVTYMVPYVRYFLSHVLEFQFYEKLCNLSGHNGSLFLCDFQGSKTAGKAFEQMLQKGDSQHWKITLRQFLGSPNAKMSAKSVINYFKPLLSWLKEENRRMGNKIGWE